MVTSYLNTFIIYIKKKTLAPLTCPPNLGVFRPNFGTNLLCSLSSITYLIFILNYPFIISWED